jgi:Fe-S-cluster-containing dehydrogenase component
MMYLEGYRDKKLALANGREVLAKITRCADCRDCTVTCSQGIDIQASAHHIRRHIA